MLKQTALTVIALLTLGACQPAPEPEPAASAVPVVPIPAAPGADPAAPQPAEGAVVAEPVTETKVAPPPAPKTEKIEGDLTCSSRLAHQSVTGNVVVPTGAGCQLIESEVDGNVVLERGSALTLSATQVGGNVAGTEVYELTVEGGRVKGNLTLQSGQNARVADAALDSNVEFSGQQGAVEISGTRVGGNLNCEGNASVRGENNTVKGNRSGQCAGL